MCRRCVSILLLLFPLLVAACSSKDDAESSVPPMLEPVGDDILVSSVEKVDTSAGALTERIVIKDASLDLIVDDPAASLTTIRHMAEEMGGWVVNSTSNKITQPSGEGGTRVSVTIRVPSERFQDAIDRIKALAISVEAESSTGQDVTQEFTDLNSQMINWQSAESQLQELMDRAENVEDILEIHNELVRVRGEIERIRGRLKFIEETSAFSSIRVNMQPNIGDAASHVRSERWKPLETAEQALDVLLAILQFLGDLVIAVVIVLFPLLLIIGVPGWLIVRFVRRMGWFQASITVDETETLK